MVKKKQLFIFLGLIVFFAVLIGNYLQPKININIEKRVEVKKEIGKEKATVVRVVDGDTIEIENKVKVRYIGMNTPETVAPGKKVGCFGEDASNKNKELVVGKTVEMEKDVSDKDKYGRLLRYVYVDGKMVNLVLLEEGYASVDTVPPDVKFQKVFLEAERKARADKLGLWGKACQK